MKIVLEHTDGLSNTHTFPRGTSFTPNEPLPGFITVKDGDGNRLGMFNLAYVMAILPEDTPGVTRKR